MVNWSNLFFASEHYKGLTSLQEAWNVPVWCGELAFQERLRYIGKFYSGYTESIKAFEELGWSTMYHDWEWYPIKEDFKLLSILQKHWAKNWRPSEPFSKLSMSNRNIVADGETVTLRGISIVNFEGLTFMGRGGYPHCVPREPMEKRIADFDSWNVNVLRVAVDLESMMPSEDVWSSAFFTYLEKVLKLCEQHRIYAIVDMHQWSCSSYFGGHGFPPWYINRQPNITFNDFWYKFMNRLSPYEDGWDVLAEAWRRITDISKGRKIVAGYDIYNEPPSYVSKTLIPYIRKFYEYLSAVIGEGDPQKIQITQTPFIDWDKTPLTVSNMVLGSHPYDIGYLQTILIELGAGTLIGGTVGGVIGYAATKKPLETGIGAVLGGLGGLLIAYVIGGEPITF